MEENYSMNFGPVTGVMRLKLQNRESGETDQKPVTQPVTAVTTKIYGWIQFLGMTEKSSTNPDLAPLLHTFRGHRVILDADLAALYGVTTKRLNEALKRNTERFPSDFAFQLVPEEMGLLMRSHFATASTDKAMWSQSATTSKMDGNRSQIVTGSTGNPEFDENPKGMWSQIVTTSEASTDQPQTLGGSSRRRATHLPWAFTEHGALMATSLEECKEIVELVQSR